MRCILCYVSLVLITNAKTQARKSLILYSIANGIIALKKHVYADHYMIVKIFEKEIKNLLKELHEKKPTKKMLHLNGTVISNFLLPKILIGKMMCSKNKIWKIYLF